MAFLPPYIQTALTHPIQGNWDRHSAIAEMSISVPLSTSNNSCPIIRNLLPPAAAEELAKAACTHVETTSLALKQKTADGIKDVSKSNSAIQQSLHDLKTNSDNSSKP
jgi:hypothetical protein